MDFNIQYQLSVTDGLTSALRRAQAQLKNIDKQLKQLGKTVPLKIDATQAHAALRRAQAQAKGMGKTLQSLNKPVHVKVDVAQAQAALKKLRSPELKATARATASSVQSAGRKGRVNSGAVVDGAVGASMLAPLIYATKSAIKFESSMVEVSKATNLTGAPLEDMKRRIMELSNTTGTASVDVADMLSTFARGDSSLSPDALVEYSRLAVQAVGALDGVNKDQASSAILRAGADFKLSASEVRNFMGGVDLLSDTIATLDPAPLLDYATAMSPIARGMGMAKEQAMAFGATLLSSGYEANQSAAALDNLFLHLRSGKDDAGFKQLGLDANSLRKMKPAEVLDAMAAAAKNIDPTKFTEIGTAIAGRHYGKEITAMLVNSEKYVQSLGLMNDQTAQSTRLSAGFEKFLASSAGQLAIARQEAENAGIALGGTFAPMVASAARWVGDFVQNLNQNHPALLKVLVGGLAVAGGLIVMGAAVSLTGSALTSLSVVSAFTGKSIGMLNFVFAEGLFSTNMLSAGVMRLNAAFLANPVGVVVAALAAFVALCALAWNHSATLRESIGKITGAFSDLGSALGISMDFGTAFDYAMVGVGTTISAILIPITTLIENIKSLGSAWDNIKAGEWKAAGKDLLNAGGGNFFKEVDRVGSGAVRDWKNVGYDKVNANEMARLSARSPIITQQAQVQQVRTQVGIDYGKHPLAMAGNAPTMANQSGGQSQAAQVAMQAAQTQQQASTTDALSAAATSAAVAQMNTAASTQQNSGSMMAQAANTMMQAAQQMMNAASRPITVNVAGSLGDQGRG